MSEKIQITELGNRGDAAASVSRLRPKRWRLWGDGGRAYGVDEAGGGAGKSLSLAAAGGDRGASRGEVVAALGRWRGSGGTASRVRWQWVGTGFAADRVFIAVRNDGERDLWLVAISSETYDPGGECGAQGCVKVRDFHAIVF